MHEEAVRRKIFSLAKDIVEGKQAIIPGVRKMTSLSSELSELSDPLVSFLGIDMQTDHLLFPPADHYLAPHRKDENSREIAECEEYFKPHVLAACEQILSQVPPDPSTSKSSS